MLNNASLVAIKQVSDNNSLLSRPNKNSNVNLNDTFLSVYSQLAVVKLLRCTTRTNFINPLYKSSKSCKWELAAAAAVVIYRGVSHNAPTNGRSLGPKKFLSVTVCDEYFSCRIKHKISMMSGNGVCQSVCVCLCSGLQEIVLLYIYTSAE